MTCLVSRIQMLLTEYISSGDIEEATRCLNELEVPHLHHHLIYEGTYMKLDVYYEIPGDRIKLLLKKLEQIGLLNELFTNCFFFYFSHKGIIKALEDMRERTLTLISELFQYLYKTIVITVDQLTLGFNQVYEEIEEIVIDVPLAYPLLERLVAKCESFLPKELVKRSPKQRGRKRFLSESDGKFKEEY